MDNQHFIKLAEIHATTDYGCEKSVARANAAADEMRDLVRIAASGRHQEAARLLDLLSHPVAASWVAFLSLELVSLSRVQKQQCLDVVEAIASGGGTNSLGAQMWLNAHRDNI